MRITFFRRISQVFFLLLFIWLCAVSTLGTEWWQLRGWPVNVFLQFDPLTALGTLMSTGRVYAGLWLAVITTVLTIFFGRFFCGWVCPFGSLHQAVGYLGKLGRTHHEWLELNRYRRAQAIKYYILIFMLAAGAGNMMRRLIAAAAGQPGLPLLLACACLLAFIVAAVLRAALKWRVAFLLAAIALVAGVGLGWLDPAAGLPAASLQTGLLDPLPLMQRAVNLALLPLAERAAPEWGGAPRHYLGAGLVGLVLLAALALNWLIPRFYCRFICPLGALLGVLGRWALGRIGKTHADCSRCGRCEWHCEGACAPNSIIRPGECVLCLNCVTACDEDVMRWRARPSAWGEARAPDVHRRGFLVALVSGLAAVPLIRLNGRLGTAWSPRLIRPPGSLPEKEFLARCIKCGQCMRVCPTNIVQPAGLEASVEGIWTPVLNFRIGTSGCQPGCIACGRLCPTAAIRPFTLDEKLGRGAFAAAGPLRMGTAFIDPGRCLPWAMDVPCIVCQENCPASPKAIYVREMAQTIRDGVRRVVRREADALQVEGARWPAGRFTGGDFQCKFGDGVAGQVRRIVDNTADRLILDSAQSWELPPTPGDKVEIQIRLQRPYVDPARCTGCGICEHECPVGGLKAVRVSAEGESRHAKHAMLV